jgi:ribokinase
MKILCFGSLNLDYVYLVDHIVQPGETTTSKNYQIFDGGKGLNQAIALGRAGAVCSMAGMIGQDGFHLLTSLKQSHVNTDLVVVNEKKTGHAIIQVDKTGQNSIIYFAGSNQLINESYIQQVLSQFEPGDFILLQNEINNVPAIFELAKQKGLKIAFNPSPITSDLLQYPLNLVDLLVLNEIEGFELTQEKNPESIINKLHEAYPQTLVLLTLGKNGALFSDGKSCYHHGIYDVEVVDTTAAGDTFVGYFLASFSNNETIEDCLRKASIASSLTVSRQGASPSIPTLSEVQNSRMDLKSFT